MRFKLTKASAVFALGLSLLSCASKPSFRELPLDSRYQQDTDQRPILIPGEHDVSEVWDRLYHHGVRQLYRVINIPSKIEWLGDLITGGDGKRAEDVNAWGEVADSSWFTNRVGKENWSIEELRSAVKKQRPPELNGPWQVISGKVDGVSPGFVVKDAAGGVYFVKFDPPGDPELASGAEVVSSWFYHVLGYNVPEYFVIEAPLSIFRLGDKAKTRGEYGVKRPMTEKDLKRVLDSVDTYGKSTVRTSVSRLIEGEALGPFEFEGIRKDDPNHRIVNQHRRSLRGFHLFSAWLNNTDVRPQNTLDVYTGEPGRGYVKHYFLDFGTSLGSAGDRAKNRRTGYEHFFDYSVIARNFFAFGIFRPYWQSNVPSSYESIGLFESKQFHPLLWRPDYSNPAYEAITDHDAYWATKKMLAITDEMLEEIVAQGKYSDRLASAYLMRTLKERRARFADVWFRRLTPIDDFRLESAGTGWRLHFKNLAEEHGVFSDFKLSVKVSAEEVTVEREGTSILVKAVQKQKLPRWFFTEFHLRALVDGETRDLGQSVRAHLYCQSQDLCHIAGIERL